MVDGYYIEMAHTEIWIYAYLSKWNICATSVQQFLEIAWNLTIFVKVIGIISYQIGKGIQG